MKKLTFAQVERITQWSEPTVRLFMQEKGAKGASPSRPTIERWEVDAEKVLTVIQNKELSVMEMKARYYAEMRKQEEVTQ